MSDDAFDALVHKQEQCARRAPVHYELRVLLLAMFGNAALILLVLLIAALFALCVVLTFSGKWLAILPACLLGLCLFTLLRAARVHVPNPSGIPVDHRDAPELFDLVESVRAQLSAPPLHRILVTEDFNAAVVQAPRLGLLGWQRNELLIGLPLMKSLSVEQFKAVLAHELGHLSRGHSRAGNWIYRQRQRWSQLEQVMSRQNTAGSLVFRPFLSWFVPYFNARSFPLARANEYEADAISVRLTSSHIAAQALTNVNVIASYLGERYWPAIHKQADELPYPAYAPYSSMGKRLAAELDTESAQLWLEQALWRKTTSGDTHPALCDRLQAIGEQARLCPPAPGQSADQLLGDALADISEAFDSNWRRSVLNSWQQRHQVVQQHRRRLEELEARLANGASLSIAEAFERAHLTETVARDRGAALEQFRRLYGRYPEDARITLEYGSRLLACDPEEGRRLVERAMQKDPHLARQCCELLLDHARRHADLTQISRLEARLVSLRGQAREQGGLVLSDSFERHDLSDETRAILQRQLRHVRGVSGAWLIRKDLRDDAGTTLYVLGVRMAWHSRWQGRRGVQRMMEQLHRLPAIPGETLLISLDGDYYRFERTFRRIKGARLI